MIRGGVQAAQQAHHGRWSGGDAAFRAAQDLRSLAMMLLAGHVFHTLWEDGELSLSRSVPESGRSPLLALAPSTAQPALTSLQRLEHACALRDELDSTWAARPREVVHHRGRSTLLSDDPGGELLACLVGSPWELTAFLRVAIGLTVALGRLHDRGLVHKDIKPAHVLVDVATGKAWLTGFGTASSLPRERKGAEPPEVIAGTLAYMAPEQTGRMNRSIDSRSDIYSLGVTLYEVLTGARPFNAADPMEWIHCHVARPPPPPSVMASGQAVPGPIAAILLKLLSKTAEERYQTAAGLAIDLRQCLKEWESHARIDAFPLGAHDTPDRLRIPEKFYGREREIATLLAAFDRVVAQGTPELVLVSGYSGIGKSSVVHELHKALVPPRGLFASGKFDQYQRDIPYATLSQAFQSLVRQILGESDAEVRAWREALQEALGPSGQLMVNLIPELASILGEQQPVPDLPPHEARNRFQLVFCRFLGVFARPEHPLALFLDDLQWLDAATLDLFEHLVTGAEVGHLLLLGAYRDNEVDATHPLTRTIAAVFEAGARVEKIVLAPLEQGDVGRLLADSLHCSLERAAPLTALVHEKAGGNPFFSIQFIDVLVEEGLITFNRELAAWTWDLPRIHAKGFTDNVADLLLGKLIRLRKPTQHALRHFACLGNSAEVATLAIVHGSSEEAVHAALWEAVRAGLVLRLDGAYRFLHDRVQEAAYALLPEPERAAEHLRIGRLLLAATEAPALDEKIFDIVNQLNRGALLISSLPSRERAAELNLLAGKRAMTSTAHASALTYLAAGSALLGDDTWERRYALTFALEFHRAECEFLTGDAVAAEPRLSMLSQRAADLTDLAAVACSSMALFTTINRLEDALDVCFAYLKRVGIHWAARPSDALVQKEYDRVWQQLGSRSIEELVDLPLLTDPDHRATLEVLITSAPAVMFSDASLYRLIVGRMVNLSLEHGNSDASCLAYEFVGMILGPYFGDYPAAFRFGQLGFDLVENRGLDRFKARVYSCFGGLIVPWSKHLREGQPLVRRAFDVARQSGDLTYATYSLGMLCTNVLACGTPLAEAQREAEVGLSFARKAKFGMVAGFFAGKLRLMLALRGLTASLGSFNDADFDEGQFEQYLEADPRFAAALCWYSIRKLQARFHAGDYSSALVAAAKAETLFWTCPSLFEGAEHVFFRALARAASHDLVSADERPSLLAGLLLDHAQLARWAENCPENFANRAALVAAELARIGGRALEAMQLYEDAIHSSRENGFVHNEAIASELAGQFHAARGFEMIAHAYLRNARHCYERWGALGKVEQLDRLHPHLRSEGALASPIATIGTPVGQIDFATVVKVSQAVSSELVLDKLIARLMVIAVEHAGAVRCLLILPCGEEMRIEAEASSGQVDVTVHVHQAVVKPDQLPESVLRYVVRTQESVILDDASGPNQFSADEYLRRAHARSILCLPLVKQGKLIGVLYLENNLTPYVFTPDRIALLNLLAAQAAISLENARMYSSMARSVEEREALLREVHHRVKNNLQLVSSLLNLQGARATDREVAELFADSRNRVRSMALVHENLYRAGNLSRIAMAAHIQRLCAHLRGAYAMESSRVELVMRVSDLHLDMDRAVSCGLIINELVSNALKHAFPGERAGRVSIELQPIGQSRHALTVADNGVGLPPELELGTTDSLGLQLVHDFTSQLHGTITLNRASGTTFTIVFEDSKSTT
jgi:predicted ATPase/two-component sensor histidine kinase